MDDDPTGPALSRALDAVAAGITVQDARGRLVYGNQAAAELIGIPSVEALLRATPGELMARFEVLDSEGRPLPASELPGRRALEGKAPVARLLRFRQLRPDGGRGEERWAWVAARPLPAGADGSTYALNTFVDASDLMRAEGDLQQSAAALRRSEQRLHLAMEAGGLGTWDWDIRAGTVSWSAELERMHGIAEGSFPGTFEAYQHDIHPDDRARVAAAIRENLERRTDHRLVYRIVRPDGAVRWLEARGRFELGPDGEPLRLSGVCSDVTERVLVDEARTTLAAEIEGQRVADRAAIRMREVVAAIADAFAVCDREWTVVFANAESARRLGRARGEVIGRNLWELAPDAATSFGTELRRAMSDRVVTRFEDRVSPASDEWIEVIAYPLPEGGLAIYSRDISARKRQEEAGARAASYEALRGEVAAILSTAGEVGALLQRCCEAILGRLPVSFAGVWLLDPSQQWLDLQAGAGTPAVADREGALSRVAAGAAALGHIATVGAQAGLGVFAGYPLLVSDRAIGVLGTFAAQALPDDTVAALERTIDAVAHGIERRRAEIELDERARELARSNADLEQFAYVASHDLQEPLRIVASYNQLLARRYQGRLDPDADEFIAFSVEGIARMQRLISDLLAYSRVGSRPRDFAPVDMERVLSTALDNLGHAIADAGARVTRGPLPVVSGDDGLLLQLLQNLVGNAIKFHGPAAPVVNVSAELGGGEGVREWTFAVRDNGVGIESQYFDRIFVIFQRLHARESYPGTGIGLALCKRIVERHGGRISVASTPGQGSTFYFTLPAP
jgi:PAS domain S-box-containing protein